MNQRDIQDQVNFSHRKDLTQIRTGLRQSFIRSKYRGEFLKSKRIERVVYKKNGEPAKRPAVFYECCDCHGEFKVDEINVDHIKRVGSFDCISEIEAFFWSIWCSFDNLQILCKGCHDIKTKRERANARAVKKL